MVKWGLEIICKPQAGGSIPLASFTPYRLYSNQFPLILLCSVYSLLPVAPKV